MTLKDQGHRFCISPDRQTARWLHPTEKSVLHPDWLDVTDMETEELAELITQKPLPHGPDECRAVQQDLFEQAVTTRPDM